jgi:hypothetical protein
MNKGTPQNILTQLHMTANEYNFVSTIYYVSLGWSELLSGARFGLTSQIPYIVFEAPSNLFIKKVLPSRWQSRIVVCSISSCASLVVLIIRSGILGYRYCMPRRSHQ